MARNFKEEHSTCLIKIRDKQSRGYVFINYGAQVGAAFESAEGKVYGDSAMKAMDHLHGKARVAIFFLELSPIYVKASASKPASMPKPAKPAIAAEAIQPPEAMPVVEHMPAPAESVKSLTYVLSKPAPAAAVAVPTLGRLGLLALTLLLAAAGMLMFRLR
jgi:hypothetical protein